MVGLDQILAEVGISKTAFYKHFESKEDLVLAALADHDREMQETFRQMVRERGGPTALGQLAVVMDVVEHFVESEDFQGCIFVNVAMEFPLPHEPAHVAAAQSKRAIEEIVYELAVEAGAADPRALAKELCLIMEGAYVTRQVTGDRETVDDRPPTGGIGNCCGVRQEKSCVTFAGTGGQLGGGYGMCRPNDSSRNSSRSQLRLPIRMISTNRHSRCWLLCCGIAGLLVAIFAVDAAAATATFSTDRGRGLRYRPGRNRC